MYYVDVIRGKFFISHSEKTELMFGPFDGESDAVFVREMLNKGVLKMEMNEVGKESIKDTHTVY